MRHIVSLLLVLAASCRAEAAAPTVSKGVVMQYGPILSCTVEAPLPEPQRAADKANRPTAPAPPSPDALKRIVARKGIVIKLGNSDEGYVCFDTDTLRMAAGWTNGFLDLSETNIGTYKGNRTGAGVIAGNILFKTVDGPGWSIDGKFDDPRANKAGPMPRDRCKFNGFYLQGSEVVLSYEVAGVDVMEKAECMRVGSEQQQFITRTINIETKVRTTVTCLVANDSDLSVESSDSDLLILKDNPKDETSRLAVVLFNPDKAAWDFQPGRIAVQFRDVEKKEFFRFAYWHGTAAEVPKLRRAIHAFPGIENLRSQLGAGPARWPAIMQMNGSLGKGSTAYVVDTIPVPEENPWKSWMRISAFDFFPDGRAAVATLNGDVWLVSGLDEKLEHVTWKRFAVGFYEPLGLKVVDGKVHVHGRDQITRLHDLNGDGEADFYECFHSDRTVYPSYHAYAYDLQTDRAGSFYYVVGGAWLGQERPWHACLVKLSVDGRRSEIIATGFRAPNGMAIGPHDEITVSDNQGNWIPASKISLVRPSGFYGFVADPRVEPDAKGPDTFDQPLCWIPQTFDNSSGGQVWAPASWGPLGGKLLHTSYGAAALFAVLDERVEDVAQGGVVKFPLKFDSGIMRARFGPHDGQLYVAGLRGWQTAGSKDGCLQRVRYTGLPSYLPTDLHIKKDAIAITFAEALQPESAADPQNFAIQQWNYRWSSTYGSPDFSVARPGAQGRDEVEIAAVEFSQDRKTVRLVVPGLKPVMQMLIKLNIIAADGTPIHAEIANTIHRVPQQ